MTKNYKEEEQEFPRFNESDYQSIPSDAWFN